MALEKKIAELEHELAVRERDLLRYKSELTKANKTLESLIHRTHQEVKLAHKIQKVLVPTEYPNIQGVEFSTKFIPGSERGGDYFDIFELEDRLRFGVLLAASSGYAMSALFISVLLKMTSKIEARKGALPNKVLETMAKELLPSLSDRDKASIFYAVVDRRSFEITYAQIGENVAFIQSGDTGRVAALDGGLVPALNKNFNFEVKATTLSLNPRDRLILVSEGVVKMKNEEGEAFGVERLAQAILKSPRTGVHELRNEILFQVEKHAATSELPEDATVIIIEVKDRVIKLAKS